MTSFRWPGCSSDSREYTTRCVTPRARVASASSVAPGSGKYGGDSNCRICSRALAQARRILGPTASPVTTSTRWSLYAASRCRRNESNAPPTAMRDASTSLARCRARISRPAAWPAPGPPRPRRPPRRWPDRRRRARRTQRRAPAPPGRPPRRWRAAARGPDRAAPDRRRPQGGRAPGAAAPHGVSRSSCPHCPTDASRYGRSVPLALLRPARAPCGIASGCRRPAAARASRTPLAAEEPTRRRCTTWRKAGRTVSTQVSQRNCPL